MKRQREIEREFEAERVFASAGAALARQGLIAHQQLAVEGNPAEEILKFAEEVRADLIAMGSHGKTGALRFLMGSVSRKVLDHAKCPVLIVRLPDTEMVKAGLIEA
jgi:nucleotide-binding universal stress UspA family protein